MPFNETFVSVGKPFYSSPKFWRGTLGIALISLFLIAFWQEVSLIWRLAEAYILALSGKPFILPLTRETFRAAFILLFNEIVTIGGYLLLILWIAQFVLPVHSRTEKWKVFKHLCRYT